MNAQSLLIASCLIVMSTAILVTIIYLIRFHLREWEDFQSLKPIWRNKYPSFEELHALFDRGDVMLCTVLIASSLQLSHSGLAKTLKAHSTYQTDPARRMIRTTTFIYIMIRASLAERQAVVLWLQKLHRPISLFVFENNVLVLATFAYGLVKTHETLGGITPEQVDAIVKGIMSMADKLDPNDKGRPVPNTMAEVETYLQEWLSLDVDELLKISDETVRLSSVRKETGKQNMRHCLTMSLALAKVWLLKMFVRKISNSVLAQGSRSEAMIQRPALWCVRKPHRFLSYFHYSMCPRVLTFDGTLELLVASHPQLEHIPLELYREIFGSKEEVTLDDLPEKALRTFSGSKALLPRMRIDERPMTLAPGFSEEVVELIKCSYYRGMLAQNTTHLPQHLGVIMDGNRRYSRHRDLNNVFSGHQVGAQKLLQVLSWTFSNGIRNLTVWALSDDNLKRVPEELNSLFSLMAEYTREMLTGDAPFSVPDIRFRVVGDRSVLPAYLNEMIDHAETATAKNTKFNLQIALGYGGRSEITRATKLAVQAKVEREGLSPEVAIEKITEEDISRHTYSAQLDLPQIDTIIRTSGENRLSGFALWESHHAEFAIVRENWPALRQSTFLRCLLDLSKRSRRFGA